MLLVLLAKDTYKYISAKIYKCKFIYYAVKYNNVIYFFFHIFVNIVYLLQLEEERFQPD